MAETQENIEARLCDYIEGELDAAGRAEIEQHLAGNAEHRALIEELRRQRAMVRQLPRATAPADIGESIEGQLEREALLGRAVDEPQRIVQIRPWPRVWAVAATLLLTAGLAAIVYYVLPSNHPPAEFATTNGHTESPAPTTLETNDLTVNTPLGSAAPANLSPHVVAGSTTPAPLPAATGGADAVASHTASGVSLTAPTTGTPAVAGNGNENAAIGVATNAAGAQAEPVISPLLGDQLRHEGVGDGALVVTVDASNAGLAGADVQRLLADNHIIYEPLPSAAAAVAAASGGTFTMSRDVAASATATQPGALLPAMSGRTIGNILLPPIPPRDSAARRDATAGSAGAATTQPAAISSAATGAGTGAGNGAGTSNGASAGNGASAVPSLSGGPSVLLLRNVTRQQAAELTSALSGATTRPAQLTLQTTPTATTTKLNSGAVAKINVLPLARATAASTPATPPLPITPSSQPATQPSATDSVTGGALNGGVSTPGTEVAGGSTSPATQPSDAAAAAPSPLAPASADDRLDVVVVVRTDLALALSPSSATTSTPTTAPSTAAPSDGAAAEPLDPAAPLPIPEPSSAPAASPTTAPATQPATGQQ